MFGNDWQSAWRQAQEIKRKLERQEKQLIDLGVRDPRVQNLLDEVRRDKKALEAELRRIESKL